MSSMLRRTLLRKMGLMICLAMTAGGVTADRDSHISLGASATARLGAAFDR